MKNLYSKNENSYIASLLKFILQKLSFAYPNLNN